MNELLTVRLDDIEISATTTGPLHVRKTVDLDDEENAEIVKKIFRKLFLKAAVDARRLAAAREALKDIAFKRDGTDPVVLAEAALQQIGELR
jgi:hypothetical protein